MILKKYRVKNKYFNGYAYNEGGIPNFSINWNKPRMLYTANKFFRLILAKERNGFPIFKWIYPQWKKFQKNNKSL